MNAGIVSRDVRIGGMNKRELTQALRGRDVRLNQAAEDLFKDRRFTTLGHSKVIEVTFLSVADLGFPKGATYRRLTARAMGLDMIECPLELGPHLRLQFLSQPEGSGGGAITQNHAPPGSITVTSSPLDESNETPRGFYLRRIAGVLWLRGYWSWPGHVWNPEDVLVFCRG